MFLQFGDFLKSIYHLGSKNIFNFRNSYFELSTTKIGFGCISKLKIKTTTTKKVITRQQTERDFGHKYTQGVTREQATGGNTDDLRSFSDERSESESESD